MFINNVVRGHYVYTSRYMEPVCREIWCVSRKQMKPWCLLISGIITIVTCTVATNEG